MLCATRCTAQDLDPRRAVEAERQQRQVERGAAEERREQAVRPPAPRARDARTCDAARIQYQATCGSAHLPRGRSRACIEADDWYRQACGER